MNLFSAINTASTATSTTNGSARKLAKLARKYERSLKLMRELASGQKSRTKKDGTIKVKDINPGRTVQVTFMLLGMGVTRAAIEINVPDLAERFDSWDGCNEAIMAAARAKEVDVNDVAHLFGLVEPGDRVVPSEPEETDERAKAKRPKAKRSRAKKATSKSTKKSTTKKATAAA